MWLEWPGAEARVMGGEDFVSLVYETGTVTYYVSSLPFDPTMNRPLIRYYSHLNSPVPPCLCKRSTAIKGVGLHGAVFGP